MSAPMRFQSVQDLSAHVERDPELANRIKQDPAGTLATLAAPLQSDVWIYRLVVGALGLLTLVSAAGAIALACLGKTPSEGLTALGSAAVGALAGLLAPSPNSSR